MLSALLVAMAAVSPAAADDGDAGAPSESEAPAAPTIADAGALGERDERDAGGLGEASVADAGLWAREPVQRADAGEPEAGSTTVTATRGLRPLRDATTTTTVISRAEIQNSPSLTQDELMRLEPSASTFRRSTAMAADPTSQGLNLRGLGPSAASRTLVLADGLPLNDAFGGWVYWRAAPRLGLDRIELSLGPGSAVWGSSAMGGVVQLLSRPIDGPSIDAETSYGSFNTFELAARAADRIGPLAASIEGDFLRSDGWNVVAPYARGAVDHATPSWHGAVQGQVEWNPASTVKLVARGSRFTEELNGGTTFTTSSVQMDQASLQAQWSPGGFGVFEAAFLYRYSEFIQQRASISAGRATEKLSATQTVPANEEDVSLVWSAPAAHLLGTHRFSTGVDLRRAQGESSENLALAKSVRDTGGQQQLGGLFAQDLWSLSREVQISAALRADSWANLDGKEVDTPNGGTAKTTSYPNHSELTASPHLGLLVRPVDWLALRASGAHGFRAPTLNELYRPFQVGTVLTAANPSLRAETVWSGEAGAEVSTHAFSARATGFWNEWSDPIVNVTLAQPLGTATRQRQNLGAARVRGIELVADVRPVPSLDLRVGYTLTDARVASAPSSPGLVGKQLPLDPEHRFVAAVTYDDRKFFTATVQARALGPQYEDDANTLRLGGYLVIDALISLRLIWNFEAFAMVENLLDRRYLVGRSGVDTIGQPFTVRGGLRYRWE